MFPDSPAEDLSAFLARAFGPSTVAVIHYGSHAQGRRPAADSAYDFFVVVDDYRAAYTWLTGAVGTSYGPGLATMLANRLPPNVIAVTQPLPDGTGRRAKCCVISLAHLRWACSPRAWDHFCQGRLMQVVVIGWARDAQATAAVEVALDEVRRHTPAWVAPSLPATFGVEDYLVTALRRSLSGEIRPEQADHARTLVAAQMPTLGPLYRDVLDAEVAAGRFVAEGPGRYQVRETPSAWHRLRVRLYFHHSKVRATVRLLKHVVLYEGWLDYIVRKVERSGNAKVELTAREKRWPLIFLWPRVIRFIRTRPQKRQ
ncbi:MAG: hypothetical protein IT185_11240 [Acidobacteria bacterium]|nr:hypothetical protein [Acidobacteriota bacterium]